MKKFLAAVLLIMSPAIKALAATTLNGAGATFPYPIYKQWFAKFQQSGNMSVDYQSVGSGAGINAPRPKPRNLIATNMDHRYGFRPDGH